MQIESIPVDGIVVPDGRRDLNENTVLSLMESMDKLGLVQPLSVYTEDNASAILIAGAHRLEAARRLEWEYIDVVFRTGSDVDRRLMEISENLHRAELTVQERSEQIAEWVELAKVTQLVSPSNVQPKESGKRAAARTLGVSQPEVQRAVKIASITPEAKQAAREAGIDDNQSKLLEVAKAEPERQAAVVHELAQRRTSPPSNHPKDEYELATAWRRSFERVWNQAPRQEDREWARQWIDAPIMDARFGGRP